MVAAAPPPVRVPWSQAVVLLRRCKVADVTQTHARDVTLRLRNGRVLLAREPRIDDMFRVLRPLPPACAPRTVGTE